MDTHPQQLFVYGSLLSGFHHPAYAYISQYFTLLSAAGIKGYLYDMGNYPAAVPATEEGAFIQGELYEINNEDEFSWAMAQLDDYEGVNVEEGEVPLYRREKVTVYLPGSTTEAWVYWFNGDITGRPFIESGSVLQYIADKKKS